MIPADLYADLEEAIYEASFIPERWPEVLQSVADVGGGVGTVLFAVSEHGDYRSLWTASESARDLMSAFVEEGWVDRNSRMASGLSKGLHLVPRFVTEADYYEPGQQAADPLYTDFFWPRGMGHSAGTLAHLPHGDMICVSVERKWADGPMRPEDVTRLDSLRPHLARSVMLTARLGLEQMRSAVEALSRLGFPAAAVTANSKVLVASDDFATEAQLWTTRANDHIALLDPRADGLLRSALLAVGGTKGVRSIALRGEDQVVRNVLHVLPVRRAAYDLFVRADAILVLTSSSPRPGSPSLLQALFDLTPAEAALASHLGAGRSLNEIAVAEGRSLATLRNQLKSVLAKTGCARQAELTRMLTLLVPQGLGSAPTA